MDHTEVTVISSCRSLWSAELVTCDILVLLNFHFVASYMLNRKHIVANHNHKNVKRMWTLHNSFAGYSVILKTN